jgi:AcrR family transcriptional regulator
MRNLGGAALAEPAAAENGTFKKLKPGPGLSREAVAADQRLRLRRALSSLIAEVGFEAITVRGLLRRAGISSSSFYKLYDSIEDCLAAIVGTTVRGAVDDIRRTQDVGLDAMGGLRTAIHIWMDRLAAEPTVTDAVFIESSSAGSQVHEEMTAALGEVETVLSRTLSAAPRPATGTTRLAGGLVAGLVGIVRKTALAGRTAELPDLADEMTDWMFSIAHEEVVTFSVLRARPLKGVFASRLPSADSEPASRESVADAGKRAVATAARLAASTGLGGLTSAKIRKDAGLSRREFEEHFTGVEDCYLDAIESVSGVFVDAARKSAAGVGSWERWVFRMVSALCSLAAADRDLSRLVLLDVTAVGRPGLIRREELIERAARYVREQADPDRRPSELATIASVSAVWKIAETEVAARRSKELPRVAPAFVYMILAARRISTVPRQPLIPELRLAAAEIEASPMAASTA